MRLFLIYDRLLFLVLIDILKSQAISYCITAISIISIEILI
jgi:hypothetical protein